MSEQQTGPSIPLAERLNPQRLNSLGGNVNQIFDGVRPPSEFMSRSFYTAGTERVENYYSPCDFHYVYEGNRGVVSINTPVDSAQLIWADNIPGIHRLVAARHEASAGRVFQYQLYQEQPNSQWTMLQAVEEIGNKTSQPAISQNTEESISLAEAGFLRMQTLADLANQNHPDMQALQQGKGLDGVPIDVIPTLPSNIRDNRVFQAIPDQLVGRVDQAQNHDNEHEFLTRIADAGLTLDNIEMQEMSEHGYQYDVFTPISQFQIIPGSDELSIATPDGRNLQLQVTRYRPEFGFRADQPMRDLNSINFFALTNDLNKLLRFSVVASPEDKS